MQLSELAAASREVAASRSRLQKRARLSACLRAAAPAEVSLVVSYLTGTLPQGRIGLGPAIVRELAGTPPAAAPTLSVAAVDATFRAIAETTGAGSQRRRRDLLAGLLARATADERAFLIRLVLGELRQGALEGLLVDAVAEAASLPATDVRRAVMLAGEAPAVAAAALGEGADGLARFRLEPLSPVKPMLAQPAEDVDSALDALGAPPGRAALEFKLDGARVQIHKHDDEVRIFTRRLNDVTPRLPEIVQAARELPSAELVLDGEVIALGPGGRPLPFQVTMRRFGRSTKVDTMRESIPLDVFLFDLLHDSGEDLIDAPLSERRSRLAAMAPPRLLVPQLETDDSGEARAFLDAALAQGHEGIMVKSLSSGYAAGSRGADWLKVKHAHTFDLVVLAAEWGSGRRRGWLSNLHLGARDPRGDAFVMLGKTFKGLTDAMLRWQTERLLALETSREGGVVHVRPELVVEIAVNEIQASPHYRAGMALRFARVKRHREDKRPEEADTVEAVRDLFERQTSTA